MKLDRHHQVQADDEFECQMAEIGEYFSPEEIVRQAPQHGEDQEKQEQNVPAMLRAAAERGYQ